MRWIAPALSLLIACGGGDALDDPPVVDFGVVPLGPARALDFELPNDGEAALLIDRIDRAADFTGATHVFTVEGPAEIAPGAKGLFHVTFEALAPSSAPLQSSFTVVAAAAETRVLVRGHGVMPLEITPAELSFGRVLRDDARELSISIRNVIDEPVPLFAPNHGGGRPLVSQAIGSGTFEVLASVRGAGELEGTPIAPGATLDVRVRYTPDATQTSTAADRAILELSRCAGHALCDHTIAFSGRPDGGSIACGLRVLDFGALEPGESASERVTCTVLGRAVRIDALAVDPAATRFSIVSAPEWPQTFSASDSFEVELAYAAPPDRTPSDASAAVIIRGAYPGNGEALDRTLLELRARACVPVFAISPAELALGSLAVGTSVTRSVEIANTGCSDLAITSMAVEGLDPDAFAVVTPAAPVLAPGESTTVELAFAPSHAGLNRANAVFSSPNAREPVTGVALSVIGLDLEPCSYTVEPALAFGTVDVGRTHSLEARFTNTGTGDCLVRDPRVREPDSPFFADGDPGERLVAPGGDAWLAIAFAPPAEGAAQGTFAFYVSDPAASERTIALDGTGATALLFASPDVLDFGPVVPGRSARRELRIYNRGVWGSGLERVELAPGTTAELTLVTAPEAMTMERGAHALAVLEYRPSAAGEDRAFLHVYEQDRPAPHVVQLAGRGAAEPRVVERWTQPAARKVDVLFVLDAGTSPHEELVELRGNIERFFAIANARGTDFHAGAITMDVELERACPLSPQPTAAVPPGYCGYLSEGPAGDSEPAWRIIDRDERPSPGDAFKATTDLGTAGTGNETGLDALQQFLLPMRRLGWNAGFLRRDAAFAAVIVTDEEDHSPHLLDFYVDAVIAEKGTRRTNDTMVLAVGGGATGCSGPHGLAEPAVRYADVARRTGGTTASICTSSWGSTVSDLGEAVFGDRARFVLRHRPVFGTITVAVDGAAVPATDPSGTIRWRYDLGANSVDFDPAAVPEPNAELVVTYDVANDN